MNIEENTEIRSERENLTILTLKYKSGKAVRARFCIFFYFIAVLFPVF